MAAQTEAEAEWAALGRQTQREVLSNGRRLRPHPDPAVSAAAARYARDVLDRTSQTALLIRYAAPVVIFFILTQAGSALNPHGTALAVYLVVLGVTFIVAVAFAAHAFLRLRRRKLLTRVKMANWLAPGAETTRTQPPKEELSAAAGTLAVRYVPGKVLRQFGLMVAFFCVLFAVLGLQAAESSAGPGIIETAALVVVGLLFLYVLGSFAWTLARWAVPGHPVIELADDGVRFHAIGGVLLPWSEISEIGRFTVRGRSCDVIAFVCADPAAVLSQARAGRWRRWTMNRSARVYGTPFTLADAMTDCTADQIAETASARAGAELVRH